MEDEGKRNDEVTRGEQAKLILENPLFKEAWEVVKSRYMNAWENSPIKDFHSRERLFMLVAGLNDIRQHVEEVLITGKMAQKQLDSLVPESETAFIPDADERKKWGLV